MKQNSSIKKRILHYIDFKNISKYEFYKTTGITRGILDQDNGITESNILKFIHSFPEVNIVWLIVGEGDMIKADTTTSKKTDHYAHGEQTSHKYLPLVPIEHLHSFLIKAPSIQNVEFQTNFVETQFSEADFFTHVRDLSLFPLYNRGDLIACKTILPTDFIQWNKIYLLSTNQGILIKRILQGRDEHHLKMSSDNPSFHAFEVSMADIDAMAIVKGGVHLE